MLFYLKKYYLFFILIVLAISYGQILGMHVWQDDNALFFKLAHLEENAGFLSAGPFGIGPYKYIVTPHIPIYRLFGFNIVPYFAMSFIMYFLSVVCVYKVFSELVGEKEGKIAGFLYAAGYIASDGFIRLFNSAVTSLSIIFISGILLFYYKFYKERKFRWYLYSLILFFSSLEFVRTRTHYLIIVVILFELLFFLNKKNVLKSLTSSVIRLVPFVYLFYKYFLADVDARSKQVGTFIISILKGSYDQLFGFLSSVTNIFTPDWFTNQLLKLDLPYRLLLLFGVALLVKKNYLKLILFYIVSFGWFLISQKVFNTPLLNASANQLFIAFLGGEILLLLAVLALNIKRRDKPVYVFFVLWVLANIGSYSAYNPTVVYESVNRYLAHSFFAIIGLFVVVIHSLKTNRNKFYSKLFLWLVLFWGLGNLISAFFYQKNILVSRSLPARNFYKDLKSHLPTIAKGDILYFDVADDARGYFTDAFSVASMPETTAIAWKYGIDRYDFYLAENYNDFVKQVGDNKIPREKIYTFFYSQETGLISTTEEFRKLSQGFSRREEGYEFKNPYSCVLRPTLEFTLAAKPDPKAAGLAVSADFPVAKALAYARAKKDFYTSAKVFTSSDWRERVKENLNDQNPDTVWQADRVIWDKEKTFFGFDLGKVQSISKLVWINGFGNHTPTAYSIEVSFDKKTWSQVAEIEKVGRIDDKNPREIVFKPTEARYLRMVITKTLNSDSPGIAEAWVVPAGFEKDEIADLESYLLSPQVALLQKSSRVNVFWKSNAAAGWQSDYTAKFNLITDGLPRNYRVSLPCRGTQMSAIKLDGFQFPLDLTLHGLQINYQPIR